MRPENAYRIGLLLELSRRMEEAGIDVAQAPEHEVLGQNTITSADRLDLGSALVRLAAADRGLLAMRYLAGMNAEEIGVATGMTASGVAYPPVPTHRPAARGPRL